MAVISGTGLFSGIDSAKIIEQLMSVERKPVEKLQSKKSSYNTKISKWGNISNLINNLKNALTNLKKNNVLSFNVVSSNSNVVTASASSNALEGTYSVKVNNIASAHSIYSETFSSINDEIADLSNYTVQKLKIKVGSQESIINIDASNNSLLGLKEAINNSGLQIKANIINDGNGYRLVVSSNKTGESNRIFIYVDENNDNIFESSPEETDNIGLSKFAFNPVYDSNGNVVSGISNMIQAKRGINASLEIDGVSIRRESNEISDLINGVTLRLSNDSAGQSVTINVTKDYSAITRNVNNFVTQYNALMNALKDSSLKDDSISRQVMNSTRNILTSSYNNRTLTNYGLNHDKSGVLSLDSAKFESLLKNDFNTLSTTLDAMAQALDGNLKIYLDKIIPDRKENLNKQIENIDKTIENMEKNLEKLELSYRKKFYELEKTIASLQRSGDNLTQTLSKWGNSK